MTQWPTSMRKSDEGLALPLRDRATHEEWRRVPISPYRNYEVSSLGRIRRGNRILSPVADRAGYLSVNLSYAGITKKFRVNRLICETFHGPPPIASADAAHENGDRSNNWASNLVWKTRKENIADKALHGTRQIGEKGPGAKLTREHVNAIRAAAETLPRPTYEVLGARFGIHRSQVVRIITRSQWPDEHSDPNGGTS